MSLSLIALPCSYGNPLLPTPLQRLSKIQAATAPPRNISVIGKGGD